MVSDAKKKKAASKKAGNKTASRSTAGTLAAAAREASPNASTDQLAALDITDGGGAGAGGEEGSDRTVTGVLTSHPQSRDIHVESVTLLFHGHQLLEDTKLELNYGRCALSRVENLRVRYGVLPAVHGTTCLLWTRGCVTHI